MKIEQKNKDVAYIELDNGLRLYLDTSTGENIIHIIGDKGHPNALGEDASCELYLVDGVICHNSLPSNVNIFSRDGDVKEARKRVAQADLVQKYVKELGESK